MPILSQVSSLNSKQCSKCHEWHLLENYHRNKSKPDGLEYYCKACKNASSKASKLRHVAKVREASRIKQAKRRAEHPEKIKADFQSWYAQKGASYAREWQKNNPDKVARYKRNWESRNRDKANHYANKHRFLKLKNGGNHTFEQWTALCEVFNNRCLACGRRGALTKDHITPVSMGGTDDIWNIQPLCKPCNSRKYNTHLNLRPDRMIPAR